MENLGSQKMEQQKVKLAVEKIIAGVNASSNAGKLKYKVETAWDEDVRCTATVRNFPTIIIDEPPAFGGSDKGASPVEMVLVALGTCHEIMYSALASMMGITLTKCTVSLQADLDVRGLLGLGKEENIPPGFKKIYYQTHIESSAPKEQLNQLAKAVNEQCPVLDMLTRNVEIAKEVSVNGESLKAA